MGFRKNRQLLNLQSYYLHTPKLIRQRPCRTSLYQLFSYEDFQFLSSEDFQAVYRSETVYSFAWIQLIW